MPLGYPTNLLKCSDAKNSFNAEPNFDMSFDNSSTNHSLRSHPHTHPLLFRFLGEVYRAHLYSPQIEQCAGPVVTHYALCRRARRVGTREITGARGSRDSGDRNFGRIYLSVNPRGCSVTKAAGRAFSFARVKGPRPPLDGNLQFRARYTRGGTGKNAQVATGADLGNSIGPRPRNARDSKFERAGDDPLIAPQPLRTPESRGISRDPGGSEVFYKRV